jgi:LysM repeat protein
MSDSSNKNLQNMAILSAPLAPLSTASTTSESKTTVRGLATVLDGKALTNENSSVSAGDEVLDKDLTSDQISLYTVRNGDKIEQIAKMFGVNVNTILWANDLKKGTVLAQDQVLVILPISSIKYTVKKGDTLASITKYFKSDITEIAQFNSLEVDSKLTVGDEIIIPDAEGSIIEAENKRQADSKKTITKKKKGTLDDGKIIGGGTSKRVDTSGYFTRPIIGGVRTQGLHGHNGVDLASSYGASILAAATGKVVVAKSGGWGGGYGDYIVVQHDNGTQTLYGHLSAVLVQVGDFVSKGQVIGRMGSTGQSTGIHLHFEVRGGRNPF